MSNSHQQPELIEVGNKRLREYDRLPVGERATTVRRAGSKGEGPALAHVHVSRESRVIAPCARTVLAAGDSAGAFG